MSWEGLQSKAMCAMRVAVVLMLCCRHVLVTSWRCRSAAILITQQVCCSLFEVFDMSVELETR